MTSERIYLDNAATSWPKPEVVYRATDGYQRNVGAPGGRGAYREANDVERAIADARRRVGLWIGADAARDVIFTNSGTDSLNLALHGMLRAGDHVVTSVVEHNSVLRPLRFLEEHLDITVARVRCGADSVVNPDDIQAAIRPNTRLISLIHVSNVTGAIQPVEEVGRIARRHGIFYLVDAAQSLGHTPVDVKRIGADLLAAPAHKGLLAPLGSGVLYVRSGVEEHLVPVRQGGTGTNSEDDHQPDVLPEKYESGNHNVPAIIGLGAAMKYLEQRDISAIRQHERDMTTRMLDGIRDIDGICVYGPRDSNRQLGVVSISVDGYEPQELAMTLDAACSIQVRAGFQCAPLIHRSMGTAQRGGTIRFSFGPMNTPDQIDATISALAELAAG